MLMTRTEIIEKLKDIIISADSRAAERADGVTEDTNIMQDLGFTSIGMLYIAIAIEEVFGIRFDNVGISDFVTVRNIVDYIEGKLQ
jgi:acyl carrier protein